MPCTPARARRLLDAGRAAVYRRVPFTITLKDRVAGEVQPVAFKADPGSKSIGIALVGEFPVQGRVVLWAAHLEHCGEAVRQRLTDRRSLRRGRRGRKTRYRAPRFLNRTRPAGWLPPSLGSRVGNVRTWFARLLERVPLVHAQSETVRFDTQAIEDPEIQGVGYQQGTLTGYEVREFVPERSGHRCTYCGAKGVPLEVEHVVPRARGGSNRPSNVVASWAPCNRDKGARPVEDFLEDRPEILSCIHTQLKAPLKDAAAVNTTRYAVGAAIKSFGLPVSFWSRGRTKGNRVNQGYPKAHWIGAACVGAPSRMIMSPGGATLCSVPGRF